MHGIAPLFQMPLTRLSPFLDLPPIGTDRMRPQRFPGPHQHKVCRVFPAYTTNISISFQGPYGSHLTSIIEML